MTNPIRQRCEAEVGTSTRGWHACRRPATVYSVRVLGMTTYRLYFCKRHEARAHTAESQLVRVARVAAITSDTD